MIVAPDFFQLHQLQWVGRSQCRDNIDVYTRSSSVALITGTVWWRAPQKWTIYNTSWTSLPTHILTQSKKYNQGADSDTALSSTIIPHTRVCTVQGLYQCIQVLACHGTTIYSDLCRMVSTVEGHSRLRSTAQGQLHVPHPILLTYGSRAFSCAGLSAWNALLNFLKLHSSVDMFKRYLKTFLFSKYSTHRMYYKYSAHKMHYKDSAHRMHYKYSTHT